MLDRVIKTRTLFRDET